YAKAQLWQAQRYYGFPVRAEIHLKNALDGEKDLTGPEKAVVQGLLGDIYMNRANGKLQAGNNSSASRQEAAELYKVAEEYFKQAVKANTAIKLSLTHLYFRQATMEPGKRDDAKLNLAKKMANETIEFFKSESEGGDKTNFRARQIWAQAETFLEDFPKAVSI